MVKRRIVLGFSLLVLLSCEKNTHEEADSERMESAGVLARVAGQAITQEQLDITMERTFGGSLAYFTNEDVENKVLQSLVGSKAIAIASAKELDPDVKRRIEVQTALYREELLVKEYLAKYAKPSPITANQIENYYQEHLQDFGGDEVLTFEYISSYEQIDPKTRDELKASLGSAAVDNWEDWVSKNKHRAPIKYKKATLKTKLLDQPLRRILRRAEESVPEYHFDNGRWTVARVLAKQQAAAKPLSEVSAEIRKRLAPINMKAAIKKVTDKAIKQVPVEYLERN